MKPEVLKRKLLEAATSVYDHHDGAEADDLSQLLCLAKARIHGLEKELSNAFDEARKTTSALNEIHNWAVCSCIATDADMMQNIGRVVELTEGATGKSGSRDILLMYPKEIKATEKALRVVIAKGYSGFRHMMTEDEWSELQDAHHRVFEEIRHDQM